MRLLLAEDEKELSRALSAILTRSGYTLDCAYDGQEALDYLESDIYDGVILDIMMPKVDGLTVLKKIREAGSDVPVLILTAKSEIDDRVTGLDLGADDYLTKPFASKELLARIRSMTRRQTPMTSPTLTFGDLSLERASYQLTGPAGSLRLAAKEFQMMEMFLSHPTQILSADQLFEKIWSWDSEADTSVVWVYLSNLRKKIAQIGSGVQIKATRGVGYSLQAPREA